MTSQILRTVIDESPSVGNYEVCLHREIAVALNILMDLKLCDLSFTVNEHYICIKVYDANTTISVCGKKKKKEKKENTPN